MGRLSAQGLSAERKTLIQALERALARRREGRFTRDRPFEDCGDPPRTGHVMINGPVPHFSEELPVDP